MAQNPPVMLPLKFLSSSLLGVVLVLTDRSFHESTVGEFVGAFAENVYRLYINKNISLNGKLLNPSIIRNKQQQFTSTAPRPLTRRLPSLRHLVASLF